MDEIKLDDVIELLEDIKEDVDYENEDSLVDGRVLDSFDILALISAIDDEFDIAIPAKDIIPENFNSAQALTALLNRILEDE